MNWNLICIKDDLVEDAGVAAMVNGEQVAIFFLPEAEDKVFAVSNWDPIGKANVMSRGLTAHLQDQWVVASPLYKQHYNLSTGQCLEDEVFLKVWSAKMVDNEVYIAV
ncbi:nitrite reductase small subunit NirD [Marinomonas fungiae]|uniref:Assimilatory nitrite reductase (NAD(P)H) small subunit n=1 Tax=Marinomonas fungiae TaxID=1137284 RepID=A0A0K6IGV3_9GAMM|nr:nitrite reductase small subunit NirD [Marinomonas fungiae]CUB02349.1 assimilatory nitrite reductase (NAD(P)H) small subunit [Marinomonas fungiae]